MIPLDFLTEWREHVPWIQEIQVEQDLIISRALVEMYLQPAVAQTLVFRGGTALYKLHLTPAARYSEDIDLVQVTAGPIGPVMNALREALDPAWLAGHPIRSAPPLPEREREEATVPNEELEERLKSLGYIR